MWQLASGVPHQVYAPSGKGSSVSILPQNCLVETKVAKNPPIPNTLKLFLFRNQWEILFLPNIAGHPVQSTKPAREGFRFYIPFANSRHYSIRNPLTPVPDRDLTSQIGSAVVRLPAAASGRARRTGCQPADCRVGRTCAATLRRRAGDGAHGLEAPGRIHLM